MAEYRGLIKFDLKAWDENLHIALTGITNKRTLENFEEASRSAIVLDTFNILERLFF